MLSSVSQARGIAHVLQEVGNFFELSPQITALSRGGLQPCLDIKVVGLFANGVQRFDNLLQALFGSGGEVAAGMHHHSHQSQRFSPL